MTSISRGGGIRKALHALVIPLMACLLTFYLGTVAAYGYPQQGGHYTEGSESALASVVTLTANAGFNPDSGSCVLQSLTATDEGDDRQLEVGFARCNPPHQLDNSCPGGDRYVETFTGTGGFTCVPHGTFTDGNSVDVQVERSGSNHSTYLALINNTEYGPNLGGITHFVHSNAWGEHSGGNETTCSGWGSTISMSFDNWQQETSTLGWHYASSPGTIDPAPHCFNIGNANSTGDFNVTK